MSEALTARLAESSAAIRTAARLCCYFIPDPMSSPMAPEHWGSPELSSRTPPAPRPSSLPGQYKETGEGATGDL